MKNFLVIGLVLFICACSGKPDENFIKKTIKSSFADCGTDVVLENFKKINGRDIDSNNYEVKIEYDLVLKKDLAIPYSNFFDAFDNNTNCIVSTFHPISTNTVAFYGSGYRLYVKGAKIHEQLGLLF